MLDVVVIVLGWILLRILVQNLNNLAATFRDVISAVRFSKHRLTHLSWPMLSPEPSDFDHPVC